MGVENQKGFRYWFVAGLGLGAGLWVVTLLASLPFFFAGGLADQYWLHRIASEARNAETRVLREASRLQSPTTHLVRVPPGTVKECLKLTGGVVDPQYQVCRKGYSYKAKDSLAHP